MLDRFSLGTMFAAAALAQAPAPVMPELPNGPSAPGFDISRFARTAVGTFETFYVKETYPVWSRNSPEGHAQHELCRDV